MGRVTYGNLASVWYTYDDARRLTAIEHRDSLGQVIRRLAYQYDDRDLPVTLNEYDMTGCVAMTVFGYDDRGRLISESRSGDVAYQLSYEYDQGGNRTKKVDAINQIETVYHYDRENPLVYDSNNNRLEYHETFDTSDPQNPVLLSTTWYYYNELGNVTRVDESARDG